VKEIFDKLATEGGYLVSSANCSPLEIAEAKVRGDFWVMDDHLGYVRRPPKIKLLVYRTRTSAGWVDETNTFYDRLKKDAVKWAYLEPIETGSQPAEKK
jgi:hypothetical protein